MRVQTLATKITQKKENRKMLHLILKYRIYEAVSWKIPREGLRVGEEGVQVLSVGFEWGWVVKAVGPPDPGTVRGVRVGAVEMARPD